MNKCKWCGKEASHQFKITKEFCCSKYPQQCPEFKKKLSKSKIGKPRSKKSVRKQKESMKGKYSKPIAEKIDIDIECSYGCGKKAKYKFKNGKYCCSENYRSCSELIKTKLLINSRSIPIGEFFVNFDEILCSYGCGKKAKYKFKNGKYCCEPFFSQCSSLKKPMNEKTKKKLRKLNTKPLKYWENKYILFFKEEEMIEKEGNKLVKCKSCEKWFTPTYTQLYERIRNIEREDGGGDYLYCSEECKNACPLFNKKVSEFFEQNLEKPYTYEEHQTFRTYVLERDNYQCQYCGEEANHVHHERPQKLEPFFSLDPDYAWSCCEKCHYEKGHRDECSTGNLASTIC